MPGPSSVVIKYAGLGVTKTGIYDQIENGLGVAVDSARIVTISGIDTSQPIMLSIYAGTNSSTPPQILVNNIIVITQEIISGSIEGYSNRFTIGSPTSSSITVGTDITFNDESSYYVMAYQAVI